MPKYSSSRVWGVVFLVALMFTLGCLHGGLSLVEKPRVELQVGKKAEFVFKVANEDGLNDKEYRDFTVEFIDDKWLVRTINASIDKSVLKTGDSATIRITLEGAKVGVNDDARIRLTYPSGGKEFKVYLKVNKDPNSNLTFKLSSLSPMELLAFSKRCGGG